MARPQMCSIKVRLLRRDPKLKEFLIQTGPIVVNYFSPECEHCLREAPHFMQLSHEYCGEAQYARVNIYDLEDTTLEDLKITALPTIVIYRGGREIGRHEGYAEYFDLATFLENTLE